MITIFTDGSSRGNPGPGGWGTVIVKQEAGAEKGGPTEAKENGVTYSVAGASVTELGGHEKLTTNNRMELTACMMGLSNIKRSSGVDQKSVSVERSEAGEITVLTDSSYVINGITKWIKGWRRNGWITKTKNEVLNRDLWEKLDDATSGQKVAWKYVGGHIGIVGNERCDHIATDFADGNKVKLYDGPLGAYDLPSILDISFDNEKASSKKSSSSRARARAYSYVSSVGGVIETHHAWADCEKRVKGKRGARYKKSLNSVDEMEIIASFGTL